MQSENDIEGGMTSVDQCASSENAIKQKINRDKQDLTRRYYIAHRDRKKALGLKYQDKMPEEEKLSKVNETWKGLTKDGKDKRRRNILGLNRRGKIPKHYRNLPSKVLIEAEQVMKNTKFTLHEALEEASVKYNYNLRLPSESNDDANHNSKRQKKRRERVRPAMEEEVDQVNAQLSHLLKPNPPWYNRQFSEGSSTSKQRHEEKTSNLAQRSRPDKDLNKPARDTDDF